MKTDIPEGTIVKLMNRGRWDYVKIIRDLRNPDGTIIGGCKGFIPPPGDDFSLEFGEFSKEEKANAVRVVWKNNGTRLARMISVKGE